MNKGFIKRILRLFISMPLFILHVTAYDAYCQTAVSAEQPSRNAFTLSELYGLALEHAQTIKIAEADLDIAKQNRDKARSVLIPGLSAFGEYRRYDNAGAENPEWSSGWGFRLDQSFTLNGKELIAYNISNEEIKKSEFDLDTVKANYLYETASAYFALLNAQKSVEITQSDLKRLQHHKNAVEEKLKLQEVTITALYRANAELSSARTNHITAANQLTLAQSALKRLVVLPDDFRVKDIDRDILLQKVEPANVCEEKAMSNRSEMKSAETAKIISENYIKWNRGAYWPSLAVEGVYTRPDQGPSPEDPDSEITYFGINCNFPLFDGGLRRADLASAKTQKKQTELETQNLVKQIKYETKEAWLHVVARESALKSIEDELKYSQENFNAVTEQFNYGLSDSIDVMDANNILVTAQHRLSEARYGYHLARLNLKRTMGIFLKEITENRL